MAMSQGWANYFIAFYRKSGKPHQKPLILTDMAKTIKRKTFDLTSMVHGIIIFDTWTNKRSVESTSEVNFTS